MRPFHALAYVVGRGLRGMAQAPLVQLLAIATTAVCMVLLLAVMLSWKNAQGVTRAWGIDVPMTVYVVDGTSPADVADLEARLDALPEVHDAVVVSPDQAMQRLRDGLGGDPALLVGIEPDILPTTVEIHLAPEAPRTFARMLAERIEAFDIVDEVAVAGDWVERADAMLHTLGDLAFGAAAMVGFACIAIIWSTIRLGVYARRTEIQILRLVGGTARFVRGPFIVEGIVQGVAGAAVALTLLYLGFDALAPHLEQGLSLLFAAGALAFFTPAEIAVVLAFGALVGFLGSRAAVARYVEA